MSSILNLTQHEATPEQVLGGVVEPIDKQQVATLLTFEDLPLPEVIAARADRLAAIAEASGLDKAMIGGAPFLMSSLEQALQAAKVEPVYSFSVRQSTETRLPNGEVRKSAVFRHLGFIGLPTELKH